MLIYPFNILTDMDFKELSNILRNLSPLELDSRQKRTIIKETHSCIGRIYGFPAILDKSIQEAKEKNLKQDEAYEYLVKTINEYDEKIAFSGTSYENYTTHTDNMLI